MSMAKTFSFCIFLSLFIGGGYCEDGNGDNVFNEISIGWYSKENSDLEYIARGVTTRHLKHVVSRIVNTWGRFTVNFLGGDIPLLKKESVTDIKNLTGISFRGSDISVIEPGALRNLPQLENLLLGHNKLTRIKSGTFANLTIRFLDLSYNNIFILEPGAFQHLPNLKSLWLQGNSLRTFSGGIFIEASNIERLSLWSNDMSQIEPETFRNLPHLTHLDLRFNNFTEFDCSVFDFKKFKELDLTFNRLLSPPSGCSKNINLPEFDVLRLD